MIYLKHKEVEVKLTCYFVDCSAVLDGSVMMNEVTHITIARRSRKVVSTA